jgi:hypothetical protein
MKTLDEILSEISFDDESEVYVAAGWMRSMGFKVEARPLYSSFMWDGVSFNDNLPDRHLLHDLAHWIVASPARRKIPEFGLGGGPESPWSEAESHRRLSTREANMEELMAALLGLLIQHGLGLPCGLMAEELSLGVPPNVDAGVYVFAWRWLRERKLVNAAGIPAIVRRHPLRAVAVHPKAQAA